MLHEFLSEHREELIFRCRAKVGSRNVARATARELEFGIPVFLSQLTEILRKENHGPAHPASGLDRAQTASTAVSIGEMATNHGRELLLGGFSVDQVVHDYGDLCQAVTELAIERNAEIKNSEFQTLNRCLDDAIAGAVSEHARDHDRLTMATTEHTMNERLGFLAHEFRNLISTAMLAVEAIKQGNVGVAGSTGAILDRSLKGLLDLCARALVDVRLRAGIPELRERVLVSEFIEETRVFAAFDAKARGIEFIVPDVEAGVAIDIDRQILAGAVANLLQNAFKFTKPNGRVWLKATAGDRVLIDIEDECGGLLQGDTEGLFRLFEQRNSDRSGLGLGLGISRRGVEANGGRLRVRDVPGKGCVFTIDLPRAGAASLTEAAPGPMARGVDL